MLAVRTRVRRLWRATTALVSVPRSRVHRALATDAVPPSAAPANDWKLTPQSVRTTPRRAPRPREAVNADPVGPAAAIAAARRRAGASGSGASDGDGSGKAGAGAGARSSAAATRMFGGADERGLERGGRGGRDWGIESADRRRRGAENEAGAPRQRPRRGSDAAARSPARGRSYADTEADGTAVRRRSGSSRGGGSDDFDADGDGDGNSYAADVRGGGQRATSAFRAPGSAPPPPPPQSRQPRSDADERAARLGFDRPQRGGSASYRGARGGRGGRGGRDDRSHRGGSFARHSDSAVERDRSERRPQRSARMAVAAEDVDVDVDVDEDEDNAYDDPGNWDEEVDDAEWDRLTAESGAAAKRHDTAPRLQRAAAPKRAAADAAAAAAPKPAPAAAAPAASSAAAAAADSDAGADEEGGAERDADDDAAAQSEPGLQRVRAHRHDADADPDLLPPAQRKAARAAAEAEAEAVRAAQRRRPFLRSQQRSAPASGDEDDPSNFPPIVVARRAPKREAKDSGKTRRERDAAEAKLTAEQRAEQQHERAAAEAEEEIGRILLSKAKADAQPKAKAKAAAADSGAGNQPQQKQQKQRPKAVISAIPHDAAIEVARDPNAPKPDANAKPLPGDAFGRLGVVSHVFTKLHRFGLLKPTPIQQRAIPFMVRSHGHISASAATAAARQPRGTRRRRDATTRLDAADDDDDADAAAEAGKSAGKRVRVPSGAFDVLIQDVTGTGKSLAYLLPLLSHVDNYTHALQAIVLVPSKELAVQTHRTLQQLESGGSKARRAHPVRIARACGLISPRFAEVLYRRPPHILIATPHSLHTLLCVKNLFNLSVLKFLVCDEIDYLLQPFTRPHVLGVLDKLNKTARKNKAASSVAASVDAAQVDARGGAVESHSGLSATRPGSVTARLVFVSATITADVKAIAQQYMHRPQHILPSTSDPLLLSSPIPVANPFRPVPDAAPAAAAAPADAAAATGDVVAASASGADEFAAPLQAQNFLRVPGAVPHYVLTAASKDSRIFLLSKLWSALKPTPRAVLVFVRDQATAKTVCEALAGKGFRVGALVNVSGKVERHAVMKGIRNGTLQFVVATDMCARGLDIAGLTHVFQFDCPADAVTYLHRAGRVGRVGASHRPMDHCAVVTLATTRDHKRVQGFAAELGVPIRPVAIERAEIVPSAWGLQRPPAAAPAPATAVAPAAAASEAPADGAAPSNPLGPASATPAVPTAADSGASAASIPVVASTAAVAPDARDSVAPAA